MSRNISNHINYPLVEIPGGSIALRDDRTKKQWQVDIKPFLIAPYPITIGLYVEFGVHLPAMLSELINGSSAGYNKPMVNVSWLDAIRFCNLLSEREGLKPCYSYLSENGEDVLCDWEANGYRLPTEAEWQYACKAGTTGYTYGDIDMIAWYNENSDRQSHDVGLKIPNAWGLYDMLGNVWEWCWDKYDEQIYGSYRIFRGGSWAEEARGCGATCRRRSHPTLAIDDLGFRVARSILTST